MVYFCEGDDKEKLDWFKIINIAGEKLTEQELRNGFSGTFLASRKEEINPIQHLFQPLTRGFALQKKIPDFL